MSGSCGFECRVSRWVRVPGINLGLVNGRVVLRDVAYARRALPPLWIVEILEKLEHEGVGNLGLGLGLRGQG